MARNFLGTEPGIIFDSESIGAKWLEVDATGFNGNLTTSDNTVQKCLQKLDDLVITGGGSGGPCNIDGGIATTVYFAIDIDGGGAV